MKFPRCAAFIDAHKVTNDVILIGFFDKWGHLVKALTTSFKIEKVRNKRRVQLRINPELPEGTYSMAFAIKADPYNAIHNSEKIPLEIY